MTDIIPPVQPMPCRDIPPVAVENERHGFDRVDGQTPFAVFNNWAQH